MDTEVVDITQEILSGTVTIDPASLEEANIDDLIEKAIKEAEAGASTTAAKHLDSDDSDDEESDVTTCVEVYHPSILNITSLSEISQLNKQGVQFLEDEETDKESKRVEKHLKLSSEQLTAIAANPKVQAIVAKMRPEQLTPQIVEKLLRMK